MLPNLVAPLQKAKNVRMVIYNGVENASNIKSLQDEHPKLKIISYNDVLSAGKMHPIDTVECQPDDLACIMYTSG